MNHKHAYDRTGKRIPGGIGICGGAADLCNHCYQAEKAELRAWAKDKPAPIAGETPIDYWSRIDGKFLDAWYTVASEIIRQIHREQPC